MTTSKSSKKELRMDPFRAALSLLRTLLPKSETRLRVEGLLRQRNVSALAELGLIEDREYHDPIEWSETLALRQVAALFKKNDAFSKSDVCTAAARKSFERGETRCRITNKRLDHFYQHPDRNDPEIGEWLERMEREIALLLGDPQDFLDAMPGMIRLTNGATEDRPRKRSQPYLKVSRRLRGPRAVVPYLGSLLQSYGVDLASLLFTSVERNVIALVPKSWKTYRTIAKEPTHSLPFQLALDGFLKTKLRKWGIDLSSQHKNQELARLGSIDGSWATIDLEMASDTLSLNAVAWMLPPEWYKLFLSFRSSCYSAPWGDGSYAKFSSMGNGYTFTLETLIFTAACRAVGARQCAVYGDDIVVESVYTTSVVKLLSFLGFRTNATKTFCHPDSRFRESCGCDYYRGQYITPFYLRECPKESDRAGWSHVLNGLVAAAGVPGPLWSWAALEVKRLGLRLVPWNEDSRSGVFVTPGFCWREGKLKVDKRRVVKRRRTARLSPVGEAFVHLHNACPNPKDPFEIVDNPNFGFPIFEGYAPKQERRKTPGWRSYLLWFIEKSCEKASPAPESKRASAYLLQLDARLRRETDGTATVTSYVSDGTRYAHKARRYDPKPLMTPGHLFLWDEVVH
jgi:hypothetical protein